ncbi:hypothetical protein F5883DRAFT_585874 [Diaporthe sp. PMI_573]|nr:hypothetical protein F5883DRAFT_585874 [Diaporthaceae sp. PMI_573]
MAILISSLGFGRCWSPRDHETIVVPSTPEASWCLPLLQTPSSESNPPGPASYNITVLSDLSFIILSPLDAEHRFTTKSYYGSFTTSSLSGSEPLSVTRTYDEMGRVDARPLSEYPHDLTSDVQMHVKKWLEAHSVAKEKDYIVLAMKLNKNKLYKFRIGGGMFPVKFSVIAEPGHVHKVYEGATTGCDSSVEAVDSGR